MSKRRIIQIATYILLIIGCILIAGPLYFVLGNAFKSNSEIMKNFFAAPKELYLESFMTILRNKEFYTYLLNSFIITGFSMVGCMVILPFTAYPVARMMKKSKFYNFLYFFLIIGLFVPFQVKMMPLIKLAGMWHMLNKIGLIIIYTASSICEGVFLYSGYIASIPSTLEEAAYIDGASPFRTFVQIIYPLLTPMTVTILIKNCLWIWNDFNLPLLILNSKPADWTLVLFQYNFSNEYGLDYSMVFSSLLISILPMMIAYLFLQKHIIGGLTNGAVKG